MGDSKRPRPECRTDKYAARNGHIRESLLIFGGTYKPFALSPVKVAALLELAAEMREWLSRVSPNLSEELDRALLEKSPDGQVIQIPGDDKHENDH